MLDTKNQLPDMTAAYQQVQEKKKKDSEERWQDDDGDGKWYEKIFNRKKEYKYYKTIFKNKMSIRKSSKNFKCIF